MRPKAEEDGTTGSEKSFQSFQEGELSGLEGQPDGSEHLTSITVGPQLSAADRPPASYRHAQVGDDNQKTPTLTPVSSPVAVDDGQGVGGVEGHDGVSTQKEAGDSGGVNALPKARSTLGPGIVADATARHQSAGDEKANPLDARKRMSDEKDQSRQAEAEKEVVSLPTTQAPSPIIGEGAVPNRGVRCKSHLGGQSKRCTPTFPPQVVPTGQRQADLSAIDHSENCSGRASVADYGAGVEEDDHEEDTLLLPDAPTSQDSQNGVGHGGSSLPPNNVREGQAGVETAAEEFMVDDIDDESSTLLDRSPVANERCSKFKSPLASTPTTARSVAAAAATTVAPSSSSSALASAGGVAERETPRLPATNPPLPPASPVSAPPPIPAEATTTFNYYELPAAPEKAPEATEQSTGRTSGASDPLAGDPRQSSQSRARPTETLVSDSPSLLSSAFWHLTYGV